MEPTCDEHITNIYCSQLEQYINNLIKTNELEIMMGNYRHGINNINYKKFVYVLTVLSKIINIGEISHTNTLDISYNYKKFHNYRISIDNYERYINNMKNKPNCVIYTNTLKKLNADSNIKIIHKFRTPENVFDVDEYNFRIRVSSEEQLSKQDLLKLMNSTTIDNKLISYRLKKRSSFIILNNDDIHIVVDVTYVNMSDNILNIYDSTPTYEIEIDIGKKSNKSINKYIPTINDIIIKMIKLLQSNNIIISMSESNIVLGVYRKMLNINDTSLKTLYKRSVVSLEIQNMFGDLLTTYAVTDKADGDRCFMIICNNHIYIISDNMEITKTSYGLADKSYNGTILDGELIYISKYNKRVFLSFDCLFYKGVSMMLDKNFNNRLDKIDDIIKNVFMLNNKIEHFTKKTNTIDELLNYHEKSINTYIMQLKNNLETNNNSILIHRKYFIDVYGFCENEIFKYSSMMWNIYQHKSLYTLDGLVYHPVEQEYAVHGDAKNIHSELKWKPIYKNTIDFYIIFKKDINNNVQKIYNNACGNDNDNNNINNTYATQLYCICLLHVSEHYNNAERPILFQKELNNHYVYLKINDSGIVRDIQGNIICDKTVVEFYYNKIADEHFRWIPTKTRYDKTELVNKYRKNYGNGSRVSYRIWRSIENSIETDDFEILSKDNRYDEHKNQLLSKVTHLRADTGRKPHRHTVHQPPNTYYQKVTDFIQDMRRFNNWIKNSGIQIYSSDKYVLDLGVGRGGDIDKYYYANIKKLVGIDVCYDGLYTSLDSADNRYKKLQKKHKIVPEMMFLHANPGLLLTTDNQQQFLGNNINKQCRHILDTYFNKSKFKFDVINSFFAIHYLFQNEVIWNTCCDNINNSLNKNGFFVCSVFDSEQLYKIFENGDNHNIYYVDESGDKIYLSQIVKKYTSTDNKYGLAINVYNPFISNETVTEYIVDRKTIIKDMRDKCNMFLYDEFLFEDIYIQNRNYFINTAEYETNEVIKKPAVNASGFYNNNVVNNCAYDLMKLYKCYVFRKMAK